MLQKINNFETLSIQDGFFGVTNLGGFSATIYLSYMLNDRYYSSTSDVFTLFLYRELIIPIQATNIHLYVLINTGLNEWTPIYNNNLLSSGVIQLTLHGTIWNPSISIIRDPNPPGLKVFTKSNGAFIGKYTVSYTFNNLVYTLESNSFSVGMFREISIPKSATNLHVKSEAFTGSNWITILNINIPKNCNAELIFTGVANNPKCDINVTLAPFEENILNKEQALVIAAKKPHLNRANLNDIITFVINISNTSLTTAKNIILKETLPSELEFLPKSFKVNGITFENITLPSSTIYLGDIQMHSSILVTYKVKIIKLPNLNKFMHPTTLMFNYLDENNSLQISSSTASVIPLLTGDSPSNPCCCCHCNCHHTT